MDSMEAEPGVKRMVKLLFDQQSQSYLGHHTSDKATPVIQAVQMDEG